MTARPIFSEPVPSLRDEARRLDDAPPQEILAWALERYRSRIVLACSFGGPSGVVALDMVLAIDRTTPVYYLDTGVLFKETHDLVARAYDSHSNMAQYRTKIVVGAASTPGVCEVPQN